MRRAIRRLPYIKLNNCLHQPCRIRLGRSHPVEEPLREPLQHRSLAPSAILVLQSSLPSFLTPRHLSFCLSLFRYQPTTTLGCELRNYSWKVVCTWYEAVCCTVRSFRAYQFSRGLLVHFTQYLFAFIGSSRCFGNKKLRNAEREDQWIYAGCCCVAFIRVRDLQDSGEE